MAAGREPPPAEAAADRKRRQWAEFGGAEAYERRIGRFALETDGEAVLALWRRAGAVAPPVLDLPCGAGRMSELLRAESGRPPVAADYSLRMLGVARRRLGGGAVRCDAFRTPFAAASFGAVLSLRLVFHYADLAGLREEVHRLLRPGGVWIFDSLNRGSLRHLIEGLARGFRRGRAGLHFTDSRTVATDLGSGGFEVEATLGRYLLPTRLYRFLPAPLTRVLDVTARRVPEERRVLTYWLARKSR